MIGQARLAVREAKWPGSASISTPPTDVAASPDLRIGQSTSTEGREIHYPDPDNKRPPWGLSQVRGAGFEPATSEPSRGD